ncbi:unnamed protein product [Medioppia subpectinata]|uniref:Nuclear receptor domain-containing protein n=1 Tax=Medioppia subpectinata TaxID=1979941 RepID=A0A7R9KB03_9ACAR|nr:unnamed protein product [Medioppia subpectinata]CAG2099960.1 unnamed protein product [Medioppia subpectinata]
MSRYHFEVLTCESCKSFFRRNALKNAHKYNCFLGGNCNISVKSRKRCKSCRLNKCLALGMKTSLIYSEKRKELRRHAVEENHRKRLMKANKTLMDTQSNNSCTSDTVLNGSEISFESLVENTLNSDMISDESTQSYEQEVYYQNNTESNEVTVDISEQSVIPIARPISDYSNTFNELEGNRLTELLSAVKHIQIPTFNTDSTHVKDKTELWTIVMAQNEWAIKHIIQMSKSLHGFTNLCETDQLILIKYSAIEIDVLRMIMAFNFSDRCFTVNANEKSYVCHIDMFKLLPVYAREIHRYNKLYLENMGLDWESDTLIIDLLSAVLLFNPNRPKLVNKNMIKHQQNLYVYLLQRLFIKKYQ